MSVSTKQLRSLVAGSGRRQHNEQGNIQVERPDWGINTVTIQGKEPISLREKFSDWPEPGRIIKMKGKHCGITLVARGMDIEHRTWLHHQGDR